jgi:carboxylesterase type B
MVPLLKVGFSVIAVLSPLATARHNSSTQEPTVTVRNGTYTGIHSSSYDQDFFLGLPFAQPPLADLRFRKPQSLKTTWYGARNASAYSAACVGYGGDNIAYPSQSEDCLYLNIVRPSGDEHKNLPIGVWIHGGGYYMGSGIDQRYNLSRIVKRSIEIRKPFIGVSINYRGSAWGFLSGKEVLESGETNLGLRDQRMALQWINENIGAFGGRLVTLLEFHTRCSVRCRR